MEHTTQVQGVQRMLRSSGSVIRLGHGGSSFGTRETLKPGTDNIDAYLWLTPMALYTGLVRALLQVMVLLEGEPI